MREGMLKLLACPVCLRPLTFEGKTGDGRFTSGYFKCSAGYRYQVKEQVGLLKDAKMSEDEFEWKVNAADEKKYEKIRRQYELILNTGAESCYTKNEAQACRYCQPFKRSV